MNAVRAGRCVPCATRSKPIHVPDPGLHLPLSLQQIADYLLPSTRNGSRELLLWPPDLFAFTSMVLEVSGAYIAAVSDRLQEAPGSFDKQWREGVEAAARKWRKELKREHWLRLLEARRKAERLEPSVRRSMMTSIPGRVRECWKRVWDSSTEPQERESITQLVSDDPDAQGRHAGVRAALLTLHAIADSVCADWGIEPPEDRVSSEDPVGLLARAHLSDQHTLSTISQDRGVVLPKLHTSQVGITLRSLSLHLSFHRTSMPIKWREVEEHLTTPLNVLLLPWPLEIQARDFRELKVTNGTGSESPDFGYFGFTRRPGAIDLGLLRDVVSAANLECGQVHVVVFPECSIADTELEDLETTLRELDVGCYIAGVFRRGEVDKAAGTAEFGENKVVVSTRSIGNKEADFGERWTQHKHHRWRLDSSQLVSYQLGGVFGLDSYWWEGIHVHKRSVSFLSLAPDLTVCPLICEDLSRQEPVSEILRSFGPSLVVALLMDGPQLRSRWSAQYASVLADDPGSSVLTLTSMGMVRRWRSQFIASQPIVALWKDPSAPAVEIPMESDAQGVLLSLNSRRSREYSADGRRSDERSVLALGGWQSIRRGGA